MTKKPFITKEQAQQIIKDFPTPFHIYDEKAIRENARRLTKAFSWNKGFREYFAVKATPNPSILKILKEEGCGTDCSSYAELLMSKKCGFKSPEIMFSSNDTPIEEFRYANEIGAIINLDDITHIEALEQACGIPETVCCRYNPGGTFSISTTIMDNPGDAKYGMTKDCGLLVNSSRGIIFASNGDDFADVAAKKAQELQQQMAAELTKIS